MEPEDAYSMSRLMLDYNNQLNDPSSVHHQNAHNLSVQAPPPTAPAFISTPVVLPSMFTGDVARETNPLAK